MADGDVLTRDKRGQWVNRVEGESELSASFTTKEEAVAAGRSLARQLGTEHVVENPDRTIASRESFRDEVGAGEGGAATDPAATDPATADPALDTGIPGTSSTDATDTAMTAGSVAADRDFAEEAAALIGTVDGPAEATAPMQDGPAQDAPDAATTEGVTDRLLGVDGPADIRGPL